MSYYFWSKAMLFASGYNAFLATHRLTEGEMQVGVFFMALSLFGIIFAEFANEQRKS